SRSRCFTADPGRQRSSLRRTGSRGVRMNKELLAKYDVPIPRYTSYPTVPAWEQNLSTETWLEHLGRAMAGDSKWSMYLHVPFCESLCTFCGCNNIITRNHSLEDGYVGHLLREWALYVD